MKAKHLASFALLVSAGMATAHAGDTDVQAIRKAMAAVRPLHTKLGKPEPGDWLSCHEEPGQTFDEYVRSKPVVPGGRRNTIYIQPLGGFTKAQKRVVRGTAEFLECFYGLPVRIVKTIPLSVIPQSARRKHPDWGMAQIHTAYVLRRVLKSRLPADAAVYLALTASDLWPGEGWNFVFGQASLRDRVGVWSIYRNGDPEESEEAFRLCLLRTMKTASHEVGHNFSMLHCILYECDMCGCNHRDEADARPVWLCPECLGKLCWATGANPVGRYRKLADFAKKYGLLDEEAFYRESIRALSGK